MAIVLSADLLFELEEALAYPLFQGVQIGSTLGDLFHKFYIGLEPCDIGSILGDRLRYRYRSIRSVLKTSQHKIPDKERLLVTWTLNRNKDLVLPILRKLTPSDYNVIGRLPEMRSRLSSSAGFLTWDQLPGISMQNWRREYRVIANTWHRQLATLLRQRRAPLVIIPRIHYWMLVQSQRVMAFGRLLDELQPTAILTEFDRHYLTSGLVLTAKVRGIPTMTMIHGTINPPYGYTPLLADVAFCWGNRQRQQMVEMGTAPERLIVTGCHRIKQDLSADAHAARLKAGLLSSKPIVLLATNPIALLHKKDLARAFCEALGGSDEIAVAVRLHPSEKLEDYSEEIIAFPQVRFLENNVWTLEEALATADIVVCHNSSFGTEALLKGKITIVLDNLPIELGNTKELIERAGCPRARNALELADIVKSVLVNSELEQKLRERMKQYSAEFCTIFGDEAASRIADELLQRRRRVIPYRF